MKGFKVLVDANILVSASIFYASKEFGLKVGIKHRFYDKCKSLINLFRDRIDDKIGIYTKTIDIISNRVLRDAILRTIREASQNDSKFDEKILLEIFSIIYSESLRRLEENKDCLVRETINETKINKIMTEVLVFFNVIIKKEIEKQNPKIEIERIKNIKASSWIMKLSKSTKFDEARRSFPSYSTLKRKFIDSSPGIEDIELLSQAIYFNELYSKEQIKFYLASMDHHFVEIEKDGKINSFVPLLIKEKFSVDCLKPEKILGLIK